MATLTKRPIRTVARGGLYVSEFLADGAGTFYVDVSSYIRSGMASAGFLLQARGATVTPSLTLADPSEAINPAHPSFGTVPWHTYPAIPPGTISNLTGGTALKLQFSGVGGVLLAVL